jgi:hypothetical protein
MNSLVVSNWPSAPNTAEGRGINPPPLNCQTNKVTATCEAMRIRTVCRFSFSNGENIVCFLKQEA